MTRTAYKLFRIRKDGTIGPLFIGARKRLPVGEWMDAEAIPTKGFAFRPGWHCTAQPVAPHLSERGRKWYLVEIADYREIERPKAQGGKWFLANHLRIISELA